MYLLFVGSHQNKCTQIYTHYFIRCCLPVEFLCCFSNCLITGFILISSCSLASENLMFLLYQMFVNFEILFHVSATNHNSLVEGRNIYPDILKNKTSLPFCLVTRNLCLHYLDNSWKYYLLWFCSDFLFFLSCHLIYFLFSSGSDL